MEKTSRRFASSPMVKSESEAGSSVSHRASAAAIFIGWVSTICWRLGVAARG